MSLDVLLDQSHLVLREISRLDHSASTEQFRKVRALDARCGADIDNIIILLRIRRLRDAHRTDILHIEPAVLKRGEPRQMVKFRDYKRIRNLFDPLCLYSRRFCNSSDVHFFGFVRIVILAGVENASSISFVFSFP